MYGGKESNFTRGQFYSDPKPIEFKSGSYKIVGEMGTTHKAEIKIQIFAEQKEKALKQTKVNEGTKKPVKQTMANEGTKKYLKQTTVKERGATGAALAPKPGKTSIMAARRRCCRRLLFFKIEVRPRPCWPYRVRGR
jgi:hypothetical protein